MPELFPFYAIGHFINEPDNPTEFEVTRFGEMAEPDVEDPHKHSFYEIIWTDAGTSRQIIDDRIYEVRPGSLFFISPGQLHQFEEWQHVEGGSLLFTEGFFLLHQQNRDTLFELSFLDNFYANPCLQPSPADYQGIRGTIDLLLTERRRPDYAPRVAQALLQALLHQIQRCVDATAPEVVAKRALVIFKQYKTLVDVHFATSLSVADYAERLHLTPHHLNDVVKRVTGQTAGAVLRGRQMLEARRLLRFTDSPVAEVAAQLGFFDSSYFARVFRAEHGQSPLDFRQAISEKYPKR